MAAAAPAPLSADLEQGLRRLKLASIRRVAPEMLTTAKTQRWTPEELLRALVEVEITARDASNTRLRSKQASFPTVKTIEQFALAASSIAPQTWAYLTSLEWIAAKENITLIGPAGTGKSHTLIALGHAAVQRGLRVRYFTAAELVETLYRGLADNSVDMRIETVLRNALIICDEVGFAPLDATGSQLLFRFVAAAYERRSLAIAATGRSRNGDGSCPRTVPPSACSTGSCTTTTSSPPTARATACARPAAGQEAAPRSANPSREVGTSHGHQRGPRAGHDNRTVQRGVGQP